MMRIRAYVGAAAGVVGLGALAGWLWSLSPWLALAWLAGVGALWALVYVSASPTYWGQHGRKGPRARRSGRWRVSGLDPDDESRE